MPAIIQENSNAFFCAQQIKIKKNKRPDDQSLVFLVAEREGFEPPEQLPVHRISSAARSTTPASFLHEFFANLGHVFKIHKEKTQKIFFVGEALGRFAHFMS